MKELETIIKNKNVTLETKIKMVRTMVFPIRDRKRIELSNNSIRFDSIQSN